MLKFMHFCHFWASDHFLPFSVTLNFWLHGSGCGKLLVKICVLKNMVKFGLLPEFSSTIIFVRPVWPKMVEKRTCRFRAQLRLVVDPLDPKCHYKDVILLLSPFYNVSPGVLLQNTFLGSRMSSCFKTGFSTKKSVLGIFCLLGVLTICFWQLNVLNNILDWGTK